MSVSASSRKPTARLQRHVDGIETGEAEQEGLGPVGAVAGEQRDQPMLESFGIAFEGAPVGGLEGEGIGGEAGQRGLGSERAPVTQHCDRSQRCHGVGITFVKRVRGAGQAPGGEIGPRDPERCGVHSRELGPGGPGAPGQGVRPEIRFDAGAQACK